MTRLLVFVLVAVNLLYFGWSRWVGADRTQLTAVTTPPRKAEATAPPAQPAGPPPCATLGPFQDELQALHAQQQMEAAGWGLLRREVPETVHEGWWVYVPNADAGQQARTLNAMRRGGIRDAFAMPDDAQFRVSVGVFTEEARAEDRAASVQKLRLDALVTERLQERSAIWLDVPGVARETLSDGRLATAGVPLDRLRIETCPVAAPVAPEESAAAIIPAP